MSPGAEPQRNILDQEEQEARVDGCWGWEPWGSDTGPLKWPFLSGEQGEPSASLGENRREFKPGLRELGSGETEPLCKGNRADKRGPTETGAGDGGKLRLSMPSPAAPRAERLEAAGWSYEDGTISNLPLGSSSEATDLINIWRATLYHANADATCQGCSGRCRSRKWGAGVPLGESGLAWDPGGAASQLLGLVASPSSPAGWG